MDVQLKKFINEKVRPAINKQIPQIEKDMEFMVNAVAMMSEGIPALMERLGMLEKMVAGLIPETPQPEAEPEPVVTPKKRARKPKQKPELKVVAEGKE